MISWLFFLFNSSLAATQNFNCETPSSTAGVYLSFEWTFANEKELQKFQIDKVTQQRLLIEVYQINFFEESDAFLSLKGQRNQTKLPRGSYINFEIKISQDLSQDSSLTETLFLEDDGNIFPSHPNVFPLTCTIAR